MNQKKIKFHFSSLIILITILLLQSNAFAQVFGKRMAFIDTGNTGRSYMAEMIANDYIQKNKLEAAVISRGIDVDPYDIMPENNALTLMNDAHLDSGHHRATQITQNDIRHSDVLLTMTERHKLKVIELYPDSEKKIFTLFEYCMGESINIEDAWGKPMEAYVRVRDQLLSCIPNAIQKLVAQQ